MGNTLAAGELGLGESDVAEQLELVAVWLLSLLKRDASIVDFPWFPRQPDDSP